MTPVRSGGVGVSTPATLKDLKSNYNPFPGRTAISDNAGTRVSRFNEDPNGTHRDKEIMQKPNGGDETKTRDETTTVMPCTNSL